MQLIPGLIWQGGVLYVRGRKAHNLSHKPWHKGGFLKSTATLKATVVGHTKKSVRAPGSEPTFSDTLEFILGACAIPPVLRNCCLRVPSVPYSVFARTFPVSLVQFEGTPTRRSTPGPYDPDWPCPGPHNYAHM